MFEHVGRDEPRKGGGFDGSRIIMMVAAGGIVLAVLFMIRDLGARAARVFFGPPVEVVYLPTEELPEGALPGAVTADPMPDPPPPPPVEAPAEGALTQGAAPAVAPPVDAPDAAPAAPDDASGERLPAE